MSSKKTSTPSSAPSSSRKFPACTVYAVGFVLLTIFCTIVYGEVFSQIAAENFVCSDAEAMTFVRRMPLGMVYWAARYVLLVFLNKWVGGVLMALVLTLSAWFFDRALAHPFKCVRLLRGIGFLPVVALLSWMVHRGYNLYFRCEVSTFVIWTLALFFLSILFAVAGHFLSRRKSSSAAVPAGLCRLPLFALLALAAYGGLTWQALVKGENVRLACAMQNRVAEGDWESVAELGRSAYNPTRSVAAYYAIALLQQNQLLEHIFDIPFNYPKLQLDFNGGDDEGVNYIADCNFFAGLPNSAYRVSMENLVVVGPRVNIYKRMALCALLNDEQELARRYLHLVSKMPFQQAFVERFLPLVGHVDQLVKDPVFANIHGLYPMDEMMEQHCRQPVFLGYNAIMMRGSDASLVTSVATAMYSKSMDNLLMRIGVLSQKQSLPLSVQQAILIASLRRPQLLEAYPQVRDNSMLVSEFRRFSQDIAPLVAPPGSDDETKRASYRRIADELRAEWLGTYYYYYYSGNIDQTVSKSEQHGVN